MSGREARTNTAAARPRALCIRRSTRPPSPPTADALHQTGAYSRRQSGVGPHPTPPLPSTRRPHPTGHCGACCINSGQFREKLPSARVSAPRPHLLPPPQPYSSATMPSMPLYSPLLLRLAFSPFRPRSILHPYAPTCQKHRTTRRAAGYRPLGPGHLQYAAAPGDPKSLLFV